MTLFHLGFLRVTLVDLVDLLLVSWIFYRVYHYFRGTRAGQMLVGLIILLIASFLFNALGFSATSWLVNQFQTVWVVAFVILFQPEIRRLLIYVGQHRFFQRIFRLGTSKTIEAIVEATVEIIQRGWGALIVIQRETGLRAYKEAGMPVKAEVTAPLLISIFNPSSPLHDGAVIIQNDIIEAASCILPLTDSTTISKDMGTRHRAALGLTEESDAIVIVVSEETRKLSIAEDGAFVKLGIDDMELRKYLNEKLFMSSGD
ncbi:MAG: TIGR00159 family protein [Candidatus Neomarinimicrobiota bacterium]|nr:MAG: TIGR00159 family protein [Candidatus Neomarinimicrobiota bacterium]